MYVCLYVCTQTHTLGTQTEARSTRHCSILEILLASACLPYVRPATIRVAVEDFRVLRGLAMCRG